MSKGEVEIRFGEGREGIVPTGTYLIDVAGRFGVKSILDCQELGNHDCAIEIEEGSELLSPITDAERDNFPADANKRTRLACFAKIEKPGVIVAMVKQKKDEAAEEKKADDRDEAYRKEFAAEPLEKKIANLVQLEVITLGETFAYVVNSPFKIFEKLGDVMAEFGFKKEEEERRRARPDQAAPQNGEAAGTKKTPGGAKKKQPDQKSP
jgi:ferredoxin